MEAWLRIITGLTILSGIVWLSTYGRQNNE